MNLYGYPMGSGAGPDAAPGPAPASDPMVEIRPLLARELAEWPSSTGRAPARWAHRGDVLRGAHAAEAHVHR
jgi:hypothetical protein